MMQPQRYAVFGNPIAHSKSPQIHAMFAAQEGAAVVYEKILADNSAQALAQALRQFFAEGGQGANITVPFKQHAFEWADELSPRAQAAGAVNTLIRLPENRFRGDNTDGIGLLKDIRDSIGLPIRGSRILLLGAGGAARGVILPLLQEQPAEFWIANRTHDKASALAQQFDITASEMTRLPENRFDLIINATSGSLSGAMPELPVGIFSQCRLAYDMVYGREATPFMQFALQAGAAEAADGLGMLVCQAAFSYELWRGFAPATVPVMQTLREEMAR